MLQLIKRTAASVTNAATGKAKLFVDSADGLWKSKDESGTVATLAGLAGTLTSGKIPKATGANTEADSNLADSGTVVSSAVDFTVTGAVTATQLNKTAFGGVAKVLVSDTLKNINESSVTTTTLGYLDATSSVQTQLNSKLSGNQTITLSGDATGSGATAITATIAAATVTGKVLTGYTAGSNAALAATDTILAAFGKAQGQVSARFPSAGGTISGDTLIQTKLTVGTAAQTGAQINLPSTTGSTASNQGDCFFDGKRLWIRDAVAQREIAYEWDTGDYAAEEIGVTTTNTGAQNVTAFNAWYSTAPVNFSLYFGDGTYDFASELTLNRNLQGRFVGCGKSRSILRNTSATANLFNHSISAYYYSYEELGFSSNATKTAGAAILATNDNAYLDIRRCEFKNQFIAVDLSGVGAGNVGTIQECHFNSPAANGYQIRYNGANINAMMTNCTLNVTAVAAIGLEINQCGALQFMGCEFIGGTNAVRINATGVVSAAFFTNCFMDQSTLGSTVKIMGTFAASRIKFLQCGITNGAANLSACEIAGTGVGSAIPEAIDFELCDFYNAGFTGTTNGILVTGCRGFDVDRCRISGFTNGINVTPYSANSVTNFGIQGCTIGPTENFSGNGTGILLNTGSFTYGPSSILGNDLSGNTTAPITNNGNFDDVQLLLDRNIGLVQSGLPAAPNLLLSGADTAVRSGNAIQVPANAVRPGTKVRFTIEVTNAATASTNTLTLRYGTANTNADTAKVSLALGAGTAAAGAATIRGEFTVITVGASGTCIGNFHVINNGTTGFTNAASQNTTLATPAAIDTTVKNYIGLYISPSAANSVTIRTATAEVLAQ